MLFIINGTFPTFWYKGVSVSLMLIKYSEGWTGSTRVGSSTTLFVTFMC